MIRQEASSIGDFNVTVAEVERAVMTAGGWVISHQFFSNRLAMLAFNLPRGAEGAFAPALEAAGLSLHQPFPAASPGRGDEVTVQLSISFLHDGLDLRREVPAFG
ncbi:MAG TPA: hypothetical protein VM661_13135 [Candidatus Sulfotelmatobacter sp.]|jgi:hypothetical protein|nr:hypothetical protein [Candidatus Sulfotelmatobacter sp.]